MGGGNITRRAIKLEELLLGERCEIIQAIEIVKHLTNNEDKEHETVTGIKPERANNLSDESKITLEGFITDVDKVENSSRTKDALPLHVSYSIPLSEHFAEGGYSQNGVNIEQLWYGKAVAPPKTISSETEYWTFTHSVDVSSEMLSMEEAEETFSGIQYGTVLGDSFSVNNEQRRKFDLWIKFNPHLFHAFECMYAISREVNYAPW